MSNLSPLKPDQLLLSEKHRDSIKELIRKKMKTSLEIGALRRDYYIHSQQSFLFLEFMRNQLEAVNQKARYLVDPIAQVINGVSTLHYTKKDTQALFEDLDNTKKDLGILIDTYFELKEQNTYPWDKYAARLGLLSIYLFGDVALNFVGLEFTGAPFWLRLVMAIGLAALLLKYKQAVASSDDSNEQPIIRFGKYALGYSCLLLLFAGIAVGRYHALQKVQAYLGGFDTLWWIVIFFALNIVLFITITFMVEKRMPTDADFSLRKELQETKKKVKIKKEEIQKIKERINEVKDNGRTDMTQNHNLISSYNEFIKETKVEYKTLTSEFRRMVPLYIGAEPACQQQPDPEFRLYPITLKNNPI